MLTEVFIARGIEKPSWMGFKAERREKKSEKKELKHSRQFFFFLVHRVLLFCSIFETESSGAQALLNLTVQLRLALNS